MKKMDISDIFVSIMFVVAMVAIAFLLTHVWKVTHNVPPGYSIVYNEIDYSIRKPNGELSTFRNSNKYAAVRFANLLYDFEQENIKRSKETNEWKEVEI